MLSIRFGVVRLVVRCVRTARGFWGHASSENFLEFMGYEVASETISGPKRCFSEARRQSFTCMNIYPFFSKPHPSQIAWKNGKLLEGSVFRTVRSHLVLCCNMSPRCMRAMGVCRALALFGDAKQAMVREKVVRLKQD